MSNPVISPDREPVYYTYSHNNVEKKVFGHVEEKDGRIYLYEYRGKYIGSEFFIAFSKDSTSYKLVAIESEE